MPWRLFSSIGTAMHDLFGRNSQHQPRRPAVTLPEIAPIEPVVPPLHRPEDEHAAIERLRDENEARLALLRSRVRLVKRKEG